MLLIAVISLSLIHISFKKLPDEEKQNVRNEYQNYKTDVFLNYDVPYIDVYKRQKTYCTNYGSLTDDKKATVSTYTSYDAAYNAAYNLSLIHILCHPRKRLMLYL